MSLVDALARQLAKGKQADLVVQDISKAFGKVRYPKLL